MKTKNQKVAVSERSKVSEDCWGAFQTMDWASVAMLATGKVSAEKIAREEMASRGLGKDGAWVGFEKAAKIWGVA